VSALPSRGQGDCSLSAALPSRRPVAHGAVLGVGDPVCRSTGAGGGLGSNEF